jgi:hypothetical protein
MFLYKVPYNSCWDIYYLYLLTPIYMFKCKSLRDFSAVSNGLDVKLRHKTQCITGNRKIAFIRLLQSQINCMKTHAH